MARFRGSNWKKSRRLGISLSGTGKELEKRPYAPGQHGPNQRKKLSEYGLQLREKQKLRYLYGMTGGWWTRRHPILLIKTWSSDYSS